MEGIKSIYKQSMKIRRYFLGSFAFVIIETFFEVIIPLLMADVIDLGILRKDWDYILRQGGWMMICALLSLVFGYAYARCAAKASSMLARQLRKAEFEKIQSFSFGNVDQFETSGLITRLSSDVNVIQNTITNGIRPIVRGPAMLIFGTIMCFMISWKLSLVFFAVSPFLVWILLWILSKVAPKYKILQKSVDVLNGMVQENLTAIRLVKSFVREEKESEKFAQINQDLANLTTSTFRYALLNTPAFQGSMYTVILILMALGCSMIAKGTMQVGQLTGILSYVLQIMNSFMMMSNVFLLLTRSMASIGRIQDVFAQTPSICSKDITQPIQEGSIDFEHVSFKYDENGLENVLEDINLHIPAGSKVGIIGATGSGKSSLVSLIPRLYDAAEGSVKIGGVDVRDADLMQLRKDVGMVLQKNVLFSGTVRENLKWGNPEASEEEIMEACRIAAVDELLEKLDGGLDMELGQNGVNVSGGQMQRICIARALLKKPKILIFDDSTSAVDTKTDARIRKGLESIENLTQIIIAQRISSISHCDQIIVMDNGKIQDVGSHEELMKRNAIYQDIYKSQQKGEESETTKTGGQ